MNSIPNKIWWSFNKSVWKLTIGLILITLLTGCRVPRQDQHFAWEYALVSSHKVVGDGGSLKELWTQHAVYVRDSDLSNFMSATQGKVLILGSLESNKAGGVLALDGTNGELVWRGTPGVGSALYATPSTLYTSMLSTSGEIEAYDVQTGELLWYNRAKGTRNVIHLNVFDNLLHANGSNEIFHLMNTDTGEVIEKVEYEYGQDIYVRTDEITFRRRGTSLQAMDTPSGALIWEANVNHSFYQSPFFTEKMIFIRTGRAAGQVYAIDRQTGKILWFTEENVVSNNVAPTASAVYLLTKDGRLVGLDTQSGREVTSVEFEPAPFIINEEEPTGGYYVAVDEKERMLYAQLGDSRQLIAFQIID